MSIYQDYSNLSLQLGVQAIIHTVYVDVFVSINNNDNQSRWLSHLLCQFVAVCVWCCRLGEEKLALFLPVKVNVCYLSAGDCYAIMILTIGGKNK